MNSQGLDFKSQVTNSSKINMFEKLIYFNLL